MQLITDNIRATLLENGARFAEDPDFDPIPVAPDGAATWTAPAASLHVDQVLLR